MTPGDREWRMIAERLPGIVVAVGRDGALLFGNGAFERLPARREAAPSADGPTIPAPSREPLLDACRRVVQSGEALTFDMGERGPAGVAVWYQCDLVPVRQDGGVVAAVATCADVTARKQLEERLERDEVALARTVSSLQATAGDNARMYAQAQKAVEMRDEFLSIASHELRTPLTPLLLELQMLDRRLLAAGKAAGPGLPPTDACAVVERCTSHVVRLTKLVEDLLDVSRIATGRLTLVPEPVDLEALIQGAVESHRAELAKAGCEANLSLQRDVVGMWDRLRIEQIVDILLSNAAKYGRGRPIEIRASASGDTAAFAVHDFGIGVAKEDQERIFERFERAVSPRHYGGLGLGLYIARQLAEAHGGRIRVDSEPGRGATFIVELPLAQSD